MTARVTPCCLRIEMHRPSWPSEIHSMTVPPSSAPSCSSSRKASSLTATTTTSWPSRRAARSTRNGNCPLPAIRPIGTASFRLELVVDPLRRPAQDDPPAGRRDEVHQVAHLGGGQRRVTLDQFERPAGVVLDEVAVRAAELVDELRTEATARESDRVHAVDARPVAERPPVRHPI